MFSFIISLVLLVAGYFLYGRFVERVFAPDSSRKTPALEKADGVDFIRLPSWKVFMIQFLNIAGTGPIFGAIMGAKFGPASYLWIVFGCIFAGAVHDYFTGMLSVRNGGAGLPELVGKYLGKGTRAVLLVFTVFLLVMVGSVFVYSPASILGDMTSGWFSGNREAAILLWLGIVFAYFLFATLLPVDKIIGKIYPLFIRAHLHGFRADDRALCQMARHPGGLGRPRQPHGQCRHADFPVPVHYHRLRSDQRFPRHAEPADGPLYGE